MKEQKEILKTADKYIYNLKKGIKMLIEYIDNEEENKALLLIPQIADGIEWTMQVVILTKDIQKNEINFKDIDGKLNEVVESIENQDYILIRDVFQYEVLPVLEDIHDKIKKSNIELENN